MQINYTFDSNIYVPDSNSSDFLTELQTNLLGSTVPDPEIREINPHYRGFVQAVQAACAIFDNDFADNITVTIQFDFGAVTGEGGHSNNEIPAGATGANMLGAEPNPTFSYSDVHGYLQHELTAKSGDTFFTQAFGTLPSSWNNSGTFALTYPQLKAMGQYNASAGEVDGYVGLADTYYWTSGGMVEVLEHEISEVLGRGAGTIVQGPRDASQRDDGENTYTPLDLFRYSAGSPDLVANGGAYFSIDGGITSGGPYYDPTASGDPDAEDFNVADPFGYSTITSGYVVSDPTFSEVDFNEMDVIGYDPIYTNLKKGAAVTHFGVRAQHYLEVEGGQSTSAILSGGDEDVYAGGLDVHATVGGGSLIGPAQCTRAAPPRPSPSSPPTAIANFTGECSRTASQLCSEQDDDAGHKRKLRQSRTAAVSRLPHGPLQLGRQAAGRHAGCRLFAPSVAVHAEQAAHASDRARPGALAGRDRRVIRADGG
jgi:hypothetical protein